MTPAYLTSEEASAELGVSLQTLYAYVSRGFIRSLTQPGSRRKLYNAIDVRKMKESQILPNATGDRSDSAFSIESAVTFTSDDRLFYQGHDACKLAKQIRLEALAIMLWNCPDEDIFKHNNHMHNKDSIGSTFSLTECARHLLLESDHDSRAFDRSPRGVARTGARILNAFVSIFSGISNSTEPAHMRLALAWGAKQYADAVRSALVLCADHDLATSTLAVRVAASGGASPWQAVVAGLTCLDGPKHGGAIESVAHLLDEVKRSGSAEAVVSARLRRDEDLPGFSTEFHTRGDPRASMLLRSIAESDGAASDVSLIIARVVESLTGQLPDLFFGLAALARHLKIDDRSAIAMLAVGRSVGWIAHIIEQYSDPKAIRPRSRYVGILPTY